MNKTHTIFLWASFIASAVLIFFAGMLTAMIGLAPRLNGGDALFKWSCVFLKCAFPLGVVFAIPSFVLAVVLRARIIRSVVALLLGSAVVGAWWVIRNTPVGL
jgi:hypothetical protein